MRLLISLALLLCFVAVLVFGLLSLARELLMRDFFGGPSLPSGPSDQAQVSEQEAESRSATPLS
jgi:hypothetical protein